MELPKPLRPAASCLRTPKHKNLLSRRAPRIGLGNSVLKSGASGRFVS